MIKKSFFILMKFHTNNLLHITYLHVWSRRHDIGEKYIQGVHKIHLHEILICSQKILICCTKEYSILCARYILEVNHLRFLDSLVKK